jgi:citrate synthase
METSELRQRILSIVEYDYETGLFRRLVASKGCSLKIGWTKGSLSYRGYRKMNLLKKSYELHRIAWLIHYGDWPKKNIDHINGDKSDNRICNLRDATVAENARNMSKSRANTSGHVGVRYYEKIRKWRAEIKVNYKNISIGHFSTKEEAIEARKSAEIAHGFHPNHGRQKQK